MMRGQSRCHGRRCEVRTCEPFGPVMRELIIPNSFEWIEQTAPEMAEAAVEAGL